MPSPPHTHTYLLPPNPVVAYGRETKMGAGSNLTCNTVEAASLCGLPKGDVGDTVLGTYSNSPFPAESVTDSALVVTEKILWEPFPVNRAPSTKPHPFRYAKPHPFQLYTLKYEPPTCTPAAATPSKFTH